MDDRYTGSVSLLASFLKTQRNEILICRDFVKQVAWIAKEGIILVAGGVGINEWDIQGIGIPVKAVWDI
jgi:hypothetical protein